MFFSDLLLFRHVLLQQRPDLFFPSNLQDFSEKSQMESGLPGNASSDAQD